MANAPTRRPGRNEPCHCGSGKKYKKCCLVKDEAGDRTAREKAAAKAEKAAAKAKAKAGDEADSSDEETHEAAPAAQRTRRASEQPWRRANAHGFQRINAPRKIGNG